MKDVLDNLLTRPTFEEEFPDTYLQQRIKGKARIKKLDDLRGGMRFEDTIQNKQLKDWWNSID
jgi:hypothetical protein